MWTVAAAPYSRSSNLDHWSVWISGIAAALTLAAVAVALRANRRAAKLRTEERLADRLLELLTVWGEQAILGTREWGPARIARMQALLAAVPDTYATMLRSEYGRDLLPPKVRKTAEGLGRYVEFVGRDQVVATELAANIARVEGRRFSVHDEMRRIVRGIGRPDWTDRQVDWVIDHPKETNPPPD